jgi:hypothetical protein
VKALWLQKVEEIRQMSESLGLFDDPRHPPQISPEDARKLSQLIDDEVVLCLRVHRLGMVDIEELMAMSMPKIATLEGSHVQDKQKLLKICKSLNITPEQQAIIIHRRAAIMEKLDRVFAERAELNGRIVDVVSQCVGSPKEEANNGEDAGGHYPSPAESFELSQLVTRLEDNLRQEQLCSSEIEYVVYKQVLTPAQSARFIIESFPDHCDCLGFMNAVWEMNQQAASS